MRGDTKSESRCSSTIFGRAPTSNDSPHVQDGVDDDERLALRAEGLDPDDPAVIAAIDLVRWELSWLRGA